MRPTLLPLPRPPRQEMGELALVQAAQRCFARAVAGEVVQAFRACLQLGDRLRAAEHEYAEHCRLRREQVERLVEQVPVLRDARARARRQACPADLTEALRRGAHSRLVVVHDGLTVRRLVAREPQRVERQRILVGCRPLLLDQAAEDAQLGGLQALGAHALQLRNSRPPATCEPGSQPEPGSVFARQARTSGLYLMRCGSSASGLRVSFTHSAYSAQSPSNQVTCESPSKARMCVATRSRNQRSCVITTAQPAKSSSASSSARSVSTSRSFVGSSRSSTLAPLFSIFARWTRFRSPPDSFPTGFCWSPPLKLNHEVYWRELTSRLPRRTTSCPSEISFQTVLLGSRSPRDWSTYPS